MANHHVELGRRLRAAREACGMTLEEVARHVEISRGTLTQMEAGRRPVSSRELDRLAFVLGRDLRDLLGERFREEDPLTALFRAEPEAADRPVVFERLRACLALARALADLEELLGVERVPIVDAYYPLPAPRSRWEAVQQGEHVATEERRRLRLGTRPAPDVAQLLEAQGIRTALVDLPEDVSGLTLSDPVVGFFVVANRAHHHLRRRFSFAHEYAHVVLDQGRFGLVSRASQRGDLLEVRANAFAAGLLLPEDGVLQFIAHIGKGDPSEMFMEVFEGDEPPDPRMPRSAERAIQLYDVVQMAHVFGVSRSAATYRLRNLRILGSRELAALKTQDEVGKGRDMAELLGFAEPDHTASRNEFRNRFICLALEAYRRTEISRGKLRELGHMVAVNAADLELLIELSEIEADDATAPHPEGET